MLTSMRWIPAPPLAQLLALVTVASVSRCTPKQTQPPTAEKRTHWVDSPHGRRLDEYYWLRDDSRSDPEVLAYLEAENAYADHALEPVEDLERALEAEMIGRLEPNHDGIPTRRGEHDYFLRYREGDEYPVHLRRAAEPGAVEEVVLDERARAEGHEFYSLAGLEVSPDGARVAFAEDTVGRRLYTVRVLDLATGELLPDELPGTTGSFAWDARGEHLLYVARDPGTLLGRTAKLHRLGTPVHEDRLVYEEDDRSFYMGVGRTPDPRGPVRVLAPRLVAFKYSATHIDQRWVIHTDWGAPDYRVMEVADEAAGDRSRWRGLYRPAPGTFLQGMVVTNSHLVLQERLRGVARVRLRPWTGGPDRLVDPTHRAAALQLLPHPDPAVVAVRVKESSLVEPGRVDELHLHSDRRRTIWREPVRGDHDPADYFTARIQARTRDRARVPVTLAHRKGLRRDGTAPMVVYGYGAYGSIQEPMFRNHVLSLLDRGVVFAIAHVRGGQELGRDWYEQGRLLAKRNTFGDFVDATESLVRLGVASRERICAAGGSAGGLLVGAVVNQRPDLYRAAVAHVPFVDVVTTMLDPSIPLTTNEYQEWGDPRKKAFYEAMLAYSPYDNVEAQGYPAMYVTTGLWDSQVQYWEPAKWVARLRDRKTDPRRLVLRTNMTAGHGGASGRLSRYAERAEEYAFVLRELGVAGPRP
jgi:oligopeptidase B